jgi:hypothetical protein
MHTYAYECMYVHMKANECIYECIIMNLKEFVLMKTEREITLRMNSYEINFIKLI